MGGCKRGEGGEVSRDDMAGMRQGLSYPPIQPPPPSPPPVCVCVSPANAKLKAFATCIHIQLKAPRCSRGETAAETPCCLFPSVVVEKVAARLPSMVSTPTPPPFLTHKHVHTQHSTSQNHIKMFTREAVSLFHRPLISPA